MLIALAGVVHGVRHAVDHLLIRKGVEHLPRLSVATDEACRQQELQPRRHGCEFLVAGKLADACLATKGGPPALPGRQ